MYPLFPFVFSVLTIPPRISIVCAHPPVRGQASRTRRKVANENGAIWVLREWDIMARTPSGLGERNSDCIGVYLFRGKVESTNYS
jgi:hypothetical protein